MVPRSIEPNLRAALSDTPVVLLHGPRQSGKSTLAKSLATGKAKREYITLDDANNLHAALSDPQGFISKLDGPVTIDEVQLAPGLARAIKIAVDEKRTPGRFLLTGSADALMLPGLAHALVGRLEIVPLWPLAQCELEERKSDFIDRVFSGQRLPFNVPESATPLIDRICAGGFPEPVTRLAPNRRHAWYASYVDTMLKRDVRDMSNIEGLSDLPRMLSLLASRVSGLLNFSDLARTLAMPQTTLKRYISLLEATFLVHPIPAWASNFGLRLAKAAKVSICDTGLTTNLLNLDAQALARDRNLLGPLTENFVTMELLRQSTWSSVNPRLFHFRTPAGREVDIVLESRAGHVVGIEVKAGSTVTPADFSGLRHLAELLGKKFVAGIVLYDGQHSLPFGDKFTAAPIHSLWS